MKKHQLSLLPLLSFLFVVFVGSPASAFDVYLSAKQFTKTMPDGAQVVMWGFATDEDSNLATDALEPATSPGPMITVPPEDSTLNVHLRNDLGVPVSLVIPALPAPLAPVRFTDGQGRSRVQSLNVETAPGQTRTYSWTVRPGSFIYQSGTHMAVQVPMGLYGGVKKDAASGQAYSRTDTAYQNEVTLFYSEVDPALNAAVAGGTYGTAAYPSAIKYSPRYFLINGEPYAVGASSIPAGMPNETTLVRFFNAGIETHAPVAQGLYMKLLSEDGNLYQFPREQYSVLLPASKTSDALIEPEAAGDYAVYDRRLFLVNNGTANGGFFSVLRVSSGLFAADDAYTVEQDSILSVPLPGVCANDSMPQEAQAGVVGEPSNGTLALNNDCSFTYTPAAAFSGSDSFTYRLSTQNAQSNTATVSITVTPVVQTPVANNDSYSTNEDTALNAASPGVLANDTVSGANPRAVVVTGTANGVLNLSATGSFSYMPAAQTSGPDSFTYKIVTDSSESNVATVNITVNPVNDPPSAANDSASTSKNTPVTISVLANDADIEGSPLTVSALTQPANGTAVVNADNTITYTPNAEYVGIDTFTYRADDGAAQSAAAVVTVNVIQTPTVVNDAYSVNEDTNLIVAAPGVLSNDITMGDMPSAVAVAPPANGILEFATDGAFNYRPNLNFSGSDSFTYRFTSGGIQSSIGSVAITVNPVNDAPTAVNDTASTAFNTAVKISALANDTDPDGNPLSIAVVTGAPASGSVAINPDNTFTYTPNTGFVGTDRFYYTATDGALRSNVGKVTVTVRANQAPVAVIDYADTRVNTPFVFDVAANDYDPDGTIVRSTVTVLTVPARGGSVVNNGDGTVTFTPLANFAGTDYFYYTIKDNYGATSRSAKATIHVLR